MKKFYFLIVAFILVSHLKAQDFSKARIGIQGGSTYATFNETGSSGSKYSNSYRFGYTGGVYFFLPFDSNWAIQPELNYQQIGGKTEGAFLNLDYNHKIGIALNYISVPILVKYHFTNTPFSLLAGPQFSVLNRAREITNSDESINIKSDLRANDISGVFGAEYKLPIFENHFFTISARYQLGLNDNLKNTSNNDGSPLRNRAFSLLLGYSF